VNSLSPRLDIRCTACNETLAENCCDSPPKSHDRGERSHRRKRLASVNDSPYDLSHQKIVFYLRSPKLDVYAILEPGPNPRCGHRCRARSQSITSSTDRLQRAAQGRRDRRRGSGTRHGNSDRRRRELWLSGATTARCTSSTRRPAGSRTASRSAGSRTGCACGHSPDATLGTHGELR